MAGFGRLPAGVGPGHGRRGPGLHPGVRFSGGKAGAMRGLCGANRKRPAGAGLLCHVLFSCGGKWRRVREGC